MLGGYLIPAWLAVAPLSGRQHVLPFSRAWAAVEPVRHKDRVFLVVIASYQDVGALKSLIKVAEDVENSNNSFGSFLWAGHICIGLC